MSGHSGHDLGCWLIVVSVHRRLDRGHRLIVVSRRCGLGHWFILVPGYGGLDLCHRLIVVSGYGGLNLGRLADCCVRPPRPRSWLLADCRISPPLSLIAVTGWLIVVSVHRRLDRGHWLIVVSRRCGLGHWFMVPFCAPNCAPFSFFALWFCPLFGPLLCVWSPVLGPL